MLLQVGRCLRNERGHSLGSTASSCCLVTCRLSLSYSKSTAARCLDAILQAALSASSWLMKLSPSGKLLPIVFPNALGIERTPGQCCCNARHSSTSSFCYSCHRHCTSLRTTCLANGREAEPGMCRLSKAQGPEKERCHRRLCVSHQLHTLPEQESLSL